MRHQVARAANQSASSPDRRMKGWPLGWFRISQPRQVMGLRMPVPMALEKASLAEKRVAEETQAPGRRAGAAGVEDLQFSRPQHTLGKSLAATFQRGLDAAQVAKVGAYAVDHAGAWAWRMQRW